MKTNQRNRETATWPRTLDARARGQWFIGAVMTLFCYVINTGLLSSLHLDEFHASYFVAPYYVMLHPALLLVVGAYIVARKREPK